MSSPPPSSFGPLLCFLSNSSFYAPFFSSFLKSLLSCKKPSWWVFASALGVREEEEEGVVG